VLGLVDPAAAEAIQVNRFVLFLTGHQPGKWRLIIDPSFLPGRSISEGVNPALCSLTYTLEDEVSKKVLALGRGALLAKFDVQGAFRIVPVHPVDQWLLGMRWQGQTYVDKVLAFGLCSTLKIYNALTDGLPWILASKDGVKGIHYLDDFLLYVFGTPDPRQCGIALSKALAHCAQLGVPVASDRTEVPSTVLVFLGIQLDT